MSHQLGTEVAYSKEVIRPFNQPSVLLLEDRQSAETKKYKFIFSPLNVNVNEALTEIQVSGLCAISLQQNWSEQQLLSAI